MDQPKETAAQRDELPFLSTLEPPRTALEAFERAWQRAETAIESSRVARSGRAPLTGS